MKKIALLGVALCWILVCDQTNSMGKCVVSGRLLETSREICGEYEPAPYHSIQDPWDGGRISNQDNTILRTEKDRDWDMTTYFQPVKPMGENLVLMYLCGTNKEGGKISWVQLFENSDDGYLVSYSGGSELIKQVLKPTKEGFQKFEYTLGPKNPSGDDISFSQQMVNLIQIRREIEIELSYNLRSRTFFATHAQFQSPPTDDEFDWQTWEKQVEKYEKDFLEAFNGERLAFETLARQVRFPEAVPAENIFWVWERTERVNLFPSQKEQKAVSAISRQMDAEYREMTRQKQGQLSNPLMESSRETHIFDGGIVNIDTRVVFDDSGKNRSVQDLMTIKHHISWKMPPRVIAQAGGNLTFALFATREVSFPRNAILVPSPFPDIRASLTYTPLDENERDKEHGGGGVYATLLDQYQNSGPGKVIQKTELGFPLDGFFSEGVTVTLNCSTISVAGLRSLDGAGLKLYYKRKIMTPNQASALSETLGEKLNIDLPQPLL